MTDDATDEGNGGEVTTRAADVAYDVDVAERPSGAVVRAVASLTNTPVLDLDPLYDVVDPDRFDEVVEGAGGGPEGAR